MKVGVVDSQGAQRQGKQGKQGKVREFSWQGKIREKSGNLLPGQGKNNQGILFIQPIPCIFNV